MPFSYVPPKSRTFRRMIQWGDLYWFDFGKPASQQKSFALPHPAVIVNDTSLTLPGSVLLVPITDLTHKKPGYEFYVNIMRSDCPQLDKDSIAKTDQIYCVSRQPHLPDQYYIGTLSLDVMKRIYAKLLKALNISRVI